MSAAISTRCLHRYDAIVGRRTGSWNPSMFQVRILSVMHLGARTVRVSFPERLETFCAPGFIPSSEEGAPCCGSSIPVLACPPSPLCFKGSPEGGGRFLLILSSFCSRFSLFQSVGLFNSRHPLRLLPTEFSPCRRPPPRATRCRELSRGISRFRLTTPKGTTREKGKYILVDLDTTRLAQPHSSS